jgi:hypothetical protein
MKGIDGNTRVPLGMVVLSLSAIVGGGMWLERRLTTVEIKTDQKIDISATVTKIQVDVAVVKNQVEELVKEAGERRRARQEASRSQRRVIPITLEEFRSSRAATVAGARSKRVTETN